jgi:HEPN domain-containing protein
MSASELKLKLELINKITEVTEIRIIKELKKVLDFELDEGIFELSQEQKKRVEKARVEFANGEVFSNDEVENELERWLNEK